MTKLMIFSNDDLSKLASGNAIMVTSGEGVKTIFMADDLYRQASREGLDKILKLANTVPDDSLECRKYGVARVTSSFIENN